MIMHILLQGKKYMTSELYNLMF